MSKQLVQFLWAMIILSLMAGLAACSSTSPEPTPPIQSTRSAATRATVPDAVATSSLLTITKTSTTPFPTIPAPDAEVVPLYPDAKNVDNTDVYGHYWWYARYETFATQEDLAAFYKEQLPKKGWVLVNESVQQESGNPPLGWKPTIGMSWEWSGSALPMPLPLPWDLTLVVSLINDHERGIRLVDLYLDRVPNVERIPMYRDAQQVETKELPSEIVPERFRDIHIWYMTDATPEEVTAYYLANLPQHGWTRRTDLSGTVFQWSRGNHHNRTWIRIIITADRGSDGRTRVHMKLEGTYDLIRQAGYIYRQTRIET